MEKTKTGQTFVMHEDVLAEKMPTWHRRRILAHGPEMMMEEKILFDYYERITGTPEEKPYYEIVLYEHTKDQVLMEVYTNGGMPEEEKTSREVPVKVYDDAMKLVKKYRMYRWNENEEFAIDGRMYVCKFWYKDKFIRVSSDNMPENGTRIFAEIKESLI